MRPTFINRLESKGVKLPSNMFAERILMRGLKSSEAAGESHAETAGDRQDRPGTARTAEADRVPGTAGIATRAGRPAPHDPLRWIA